MVLSEDIAYLIDDDELDTISLQGSLTADTNSTKSFNSSVFTTTELNGRVELTDEERPRTLSMSQKQNVYHSINEQNMTTIDKNSETGSKIKTNESQVGNTDESSTVPVYYCLHNGKIVKAPVVTTREHGGNEIQTLPLAQEIYTNTAPLRKRKIRLLQVLSVVAVVVFFPLGIPAIYFSSGIQQEFDQGLMQGNIDKAIRRAKHSETLIFLSFVAAVLVVIVVCIVVENERMIPPNYGAWTLSADNE